MDKYAFQMFRIDPERHSTVGLDTRMRGDCFQTLTKKCFKMCLALPLLFQDRTLNGLVAALAPQRCFPRHSAHSTAEDSLARNYRWKLSRLSLS